MKQTQTRIADLWCGLMHNQPMWPLHGQYECRTCGTQHRVCWGAPSPATPRVMVLAREAQAPIALVAATESRMIQCS
jgi:hypothetical protein